MVWCEVANADYSGQLHRESTVRIEQMHAMKERARTVATAGSLLAILMAATIGGTRAQAAGTSIKDQLVGYWKLVSVTINDSTPYGDNPQGSMLVDVNGHYSVIVVSDGGARNISYFGTYTVNDADKTVTMHIDGSTRARADGRDQKRLVTFNGDELIEDTPPGRRGSIKMTWRRAN